jgi:hypothetical protein
MADGPCYHRASGERARVRGMSRDRSTGADRKAHLVEIESRGAVLQVAWCFDGHSGMAEFLVEIAPGRPRAELEAANGADGPQLLGLIPGISFRPATVLSC